MPWLPMYLTTTDVVLLGDLLQADPELAYLVSIGPGSWKAITHIPSFLLSGRYGIWHVPSGPLPLVGATHAESDTWIPDPLSGWTERRAGMDKRVPYFGAGHVGVFWLNLALEAERPGDICGLSSFEWVGNHYKIVSQPAASETKRCWERLRRRVSRIAAKVPRGQLASEQSSEIYAFPSALQQLRMGRAADANP